MDSKSKLNWNWIFNRIGEMNDQLINYAGTFSKTTHLVKVFGLSCSFFCSLSRFSLSEIRF